MSGPGITDNAAFNINGNQLRLTASADAETKSSYTIRVRSTDAGGLFTAQTFTIFVTNVLETPTLTMISPAAAPVGGNLVLNGTDLVGTFAVSFNGTVVQATAGFGAILVAVPAGATSGPVTVTNSVGTSNALPFTVVRDLVVSSNQGIPPGTYNSILVTGTGYASTNSFGEVRVTDFFRVEDGGTLSVPPGPDQGVRGPGSFTLAAGATLIVGEPISASGAQGPIQVSGTRSLSTDAIYQYGSVGVETGLGLPTTVRELRVDNDVTLSQPLAIRERLVLSGDASDRSPTPQGGSPVPLGLTTNGHMLTLLSTAARQAYVVQTSTAAVYGTVTVQRYVPTPATISYHHLAPPVASSTVADLTTAGYTPRVNTAYNAIPHPTLTSAQVPTVTGFDETRGGTAAAAQGFSNGYFSPAALSSPLLNGRGYSLSIKGGTTPDFVGTLVSGQVDRALSVTGVPTASNKAGWHLLGNPYAQAIDWDLATIPAGMDGAVYVWYSTGGANGAYRTRAAGAGNLTDGLIGVGQGLWVRATAPTTFSFQDAMRVEGTVALGRVAQATAVPTLSLTLTDASGQQDEVTLTARAGATSGFDGAYDAVRPGPNVGVPSLSALIDGQEALVSALPDAVAQGQAATVELVATLPTAGRYALGVGQQTFPAGTSVELLDRATGTRYDLTAQPTLNVVAKRANEVMSGRFAVLFNQGRVLGTAAGTAQAAPLAVWPNPAAAGGSVRVGGCPGSLPLTVLDLAGRRVAGAVADASGVAELAVRGLAAGTYVVRTQDGRTTKLVVE